MDGYNRTRFVEGLLERYKAELPSFTIHLHPDAWTLNSGSRFRYDNQYVGFLDDVRAHRIPVDFVEIFHESRVRYFEGCLIVDLLDYRPTKPTDPPLEIPEKTREVLHSTSETLWADLCVINSNSGGNLTDLQAIEIEARILLATSAPLCLDPNPHLSRIANNVLRVTTPSTPVSLKRKASALDAEKAEAEKARKEKIIGFLAPDSPRASRQFRQLELRQRIRDEQRRSGSVPLQTQQPILPRAPIHTPVPPTHDVAVFISSNQSSHHSSPAPSSATSQYIQVHSPTNTEATRRGMQYVTGNRGNGAQTPVILNTQPHHSPSPQPHVTAYPNPQASASVDSQLKRTPTPAQRFSPSPHVSHMQPHPVAPQNHHPHVNLPQHGTPRVQPQPLPSAARASPRPPSTHPQQPLPPPSHPQPAHSVQVPQQPLQPHLPQQPIQQSFQPSAPGANFLQQPPPSRNGQTKVPNSAQAQTQAYNSAYPPHANHTNQIQHSAAQMMMQQQRIGLAAAHQAQSQTQAHSPQGQQQVAGLSAPIQPMQQGAIPRASPMIPNAIATRSPIPSSLTTPNGIHSSNPNQNQNQNSGGSASPHTSHLSPPAAAGATNSPRPRSRATGPPAVGVNSPRIANQAQPRPVQPIQTPKMQHSQLHPNLQAQQQLHANFQAQQQQRRTTPSQATSNVVQAAQQQQQSQQHGAAQYPMYAYGVPAQAAGYPAGQLPQQYFAAMSAMRIPHQQSMHVPGVQAIPAMKGLQSVQMTQQQMRAMQQHFVQQQQQYAMAQAQQAQQQAQQAQQQAQHKAPGR
ncbi:hypothetical protein HHX47_DHR6000341 [Lentinula edodes]|nr:hypothetical protein HHX47_DHR6000341 [Lentinula edodes]